MTSARSSRRYIPPFDSTEKHLAGHNYCGPGTNVWKRQLLNIAPTNQLDRLCLEHDIVTEPRGPYTSKGDSNQLRRADRKLLQRTRVLRENKQSPRWACDIVITAMQYLLITGARGRKWR